MKLKQTTTVETKVESKSPISEKVQKLLVEQLAHEMYNHNLYMSFSNFYGVKGYAILEEYYRLRAYEEYVHHRWIKDYLNENDVEYKYPTIPEVTEQYTEMTTPFELTVDKEVETTELIYAIAKTAMEEGDYGTFAWLNGNDSEKGALVLEQIEEEAISRTALDIAQMEGSWLRKEKSIMNVYKKDVD